MTDSITRDPTIFTPILIGETDVLTFDFTDSLNTGETISSGDVTIIVTQGVDATPANLKSGAAQASSPYVLQKVVPGLAGVTYLCNAAATTNQGRVLIDRAILSVLRAS